MVYQMWQKMLLSTVLSTIPDHLYAIPDHFYKAAWGHGIDLYVDLMLKHFRLGPILKVWVAIFANYIIISIILTRICLME